MEINNINIHWLGHDGYKIVTENKKIIYIDPYKISPIFHKKNDADLILITHNHFDHLSVEDMRHLVSKNTLIVSARECIEKLNQEGLKNIKQAEPGQKIEEKEIVIEIVPAYNTDKNFHPKKDRKVGFILTLSDGLRLYHAGDTDKIPEMSEFKPDIALVPVSGVYVMTSEEAADSVNNLLRPTKLAIPMHYGTIVGNIDDALKFQNLTTICKVDILPQE